VAPEDTGLAHARLPHAAGDDGWHPLGSQDDVFAIMTDLSNDKGMHPTLTKIRSRRV
jgi:CTP:molybdopterin cytidylyltransferase MocA